MVPHNAVVTAVNAGDPDIGLARNAAASLRQPHKTPKKIVEDLLDRLSAIKLRRELRGLNHWEAFAPDYVQKMLSRHEALRQRAVADFFQVEQDRAHARALRMLGNPQDAEDAVARAFALMWTGKTGPSLFYRKLWQICMDMLRARKKAAKLFSRERIAATWNGEQPSPEPACSSVFDGGDPLEILLREETIKERIRQVQSERKYKDSRRTQWFKELVAYYFPAEVGGNGLTQTHM